MQMRLVLASLALLALAATAVPASGRGAAPARCSGHVTRTVDGETVRARSIRTSAMTCRAGKRLIRSFLRKANAQARCRRASERTPPTPGCAVRRFHCWRGVATYCARRGHDVSWSEPGR
jgi:hypothetical protein